MVDIKIRHTDSILDREVQALLRIKNVLKCRRFLNITRDEGKIIDTGGRQTEVIPGLKWLLSRQLGNPAHERVPMKQGVLGSSDPQTFIPIFFISSEALKLEQIPGVRR